MAAEIDKLGTPRAEVMRGVLPDGAKDVAGLMVGAAEFNLAEARLRILPGAICEHLTSQGAIFKAGVGQTPLSDFMRLGAAGSSGTVVEPRAIQAKFPLPSLHLHYARGCSLAEAFYQSVAGPYQLLIVGDPLCRPWARIPTVGVDGLESGDVVRGPLTITPTGQPLPGQSIGVYEIYIDGRIAARVAPGKPLTIDTTRMPDGYHDLRVVGIVGDAIETQGRTIVPFTVSNKNVPLEIKILPNTRVGRQGKLQVSVRQKGAAAIVIRQNSREIARVKGEAGDVEILAATLGRGATTLQAASEGAAATVSSPTPVLVQ
jgi:hypothetical protein